MNNKLHDILRLLETRPSLSRRDIAASLAVSRRTIDRYANLLRLGKKTWSELKDLDGSALNAMFNRRRQASEKVRPVPEAITAALNGPGMTLLAVWEDYREEHSAPTLSYSRFAALYREHRKAQNLVMRKAVVPGQCVMTDYSGVRPFYIDCSTGEQIPVELFVGVLGASNYIFACCTATQTVPDWIDAHTRMLAFFGGAPASVIPDNLRSAVTKSGTEPVLQQTYADWARHNGMAVLPARPGHPRDKGAVEGAVLIVQRFVFPKLRKRSFFSLAELDAAVTGLLKPLNERPFQKRPGSRQSEFDTLEKPALMPLPGEPFVYAQWSPKQKVPRDYHVSVHGHWYSVPFDLVGHRVEPRVSPTQVEIFCSGKCVAKHNRSKEKGAHTTDRAHQPDTHRAEAERTPEGIIAWAETVGPNMKAVVEKQFRQKVPLQGLPSAGALRNLAKGRSNEDLEAAATRALELKIASPTGVRRMLESSKTEVTRSCRRRSSGTPLTAPRARRLPHASSSTGGAK
ncbi:IS21 family transposase [Dokdonella immobilis]|uniref:Transposase n=1 Tax=Dokdonella immobilis TaxID=578942 RepID=A0A1I4XYP5_9GAMM|nr:IS21 family transposase [Dokdonella immobilis]SFN31051.1 Transposase [Dokdonella immobilis]